MRIIIQITTLIFSLSLSHLELVATEQENSQQPVSVYMGNNKRTGYIHGEIALSPRQKWVYKSNHAPSPAWTNQISPERLAFDCVYHTIASNTIVYWGSSSDHKVYAIDLETGAPRWSFMTGGPVRFAPSLSGNNLVVASDDGFLYCLNARTGKEIWKFKGGPRDEMIIGNKQMISRWPGRTGALIDNGRVYTSFGMWASDGIYIYCLDLKTGTIIWKNDTTGALYTKIPHGLAMGGLSPQGYLLLDKNILIIPNGRGAPARLEADTGKLHPYQNKKVNGSSYWMMAENDMLFISNLLGEDGSRIHIQDFTKNVELMVGKAKKGVRAERIITDGNQVLISSGKKLFAMHIENLKNIQSDKISSKHVSWEFVADKTYTMFQCGTTAYIGGKNRILALDVKTGTEKWKANVEGNVYGISASANNLLVSTTQGSIYCFGQGEETKNSVTKNMPIINENIRQRAKKHLKQTGITKGYAMVVGENNGHFSAALAQESQLKITCPIKSSEQLNEVRSFLDQCNLNGKHVVAHPYHDRIPYADYFANLIIVNSDNFIKEKALPCKELYRILRPYGGKLFVYGDKQYIHKIQQRFIATGVPADEISVDDASLMITRGILPGAGHWTHQYANSSRNSFSGDSIVKLPLKMLWFGDAGGPNKLLEQHHRGTTPLFINGIMVVAGEKQLMGVDGYNGRLMWTLELANAARYSVAYRGSNMIVDEKSVYFIQGLKCLVINIQTGEITKRLKAPISDETIKKMQSQLAAKDHKAPYPVQWEFLDVSQKYIIGSIGPSNRIDQYWNETSYKIFTKKHNTEDNRKHKFSVPEGRYIFCLDKETGKTLWDYKPHYAVHPHAMLVQDDKLYLIDRMSKIQEARNKLAGINNKAKSELIALSLDSGKEVWKNANINILMRNLWLSNNVLLLTPGVLSSKTSLPPSGAQGINPDNGQLIWESGAPWTGRSPLLIGDSVFALPPATAFRIKDKKWNAYAKEGHVFDLTTGKPQKNTDFLTGAKTDRAFGFNYGCGAAVASKNIVAMRSGSMAYFDPNDKHGIFYYNASVRPSCWIDILPVGGMLIRPAGDSECVCPFNFKTAMAMVPAEKNEHWGYCKLSNEFAGKINQLCVNFGAPGDKTDGNKKLWLAYPRPINTAHFKYFENMGKKKKTPKVVLPLIISSDVSYYHWNSDNENMKNIPESWIYASGVTNMESIQVSNMDTSKQYNLTFHFSHLQQKFFPKNQLKIKVQNETFQIKADHSSNPIFTKKINLSPKSDSIAIEFISKKIQLNGLEINIQ